MGHYSSSTNCQIQGLFLNPHSVLRGAEVLHMLDTWFVGLMSVCVRFVGHMGVGSTSTFEQSLLIDHLSHFQPGEACSLKRRPSDFRIEPYWGALWFVMGLIWRGSRCAWVCDLRGGGLCRAWGGKRKFLPGIQVPQEMGTVKKLLRLVC